MRHSSYSWDRLNARGIGQYHKAAEKPVPKTDDIENGTAEEGTVESLESGVPDCVESEELINFTE